MHNRGSGVNGGRQREGSSSGHGASHATAGVSRHSGNRSSAGAWAGSLIAASSAGASAGQGSGSASASVATASRARQIWWTPAARGRAGPSSRVFRRPMASGGVACVAADRSARKAVPGVTIAVGVARVRAVSASSASAAGARRRTSSVSARSLRACVARGRWRRTPPPRWPAPVRSAAARPPPRLVPVAPQRDCAEQSRYTDARPPAPSHG